MIYLKDKEFETIVAYMKNHYGINLIQKRHLIEGRLSNHVAGLGFENYLDYFEFAKNDHANDEMTTLVNKLTTNHTFFLRENTHFEFYRDTILPWVDKTLKTKDLRVWSAGCSSGQEPYTLAMITRDYLEKNSNGWDSTLLASDISDNALLTAKGGIYSREELNVVPSAWVEKYFNKLDDSRYVISDTIKSNVAYRNLNLLSPFSFKKPFHAILCRNVMIYFDTPTKNEIISKFYDALMPGGYFFIGHSESLSACTHRFKYIKPSIYQKPV